MKNSLGLRADWKQQKIGLLKAKAGQEKIHNLKHQEIQEWKTSNSTSETCVI